MKQGLIVVIVLAILALACGTVPAPMPPTPVPPTPVPVDPCAGARAYLESVILPSEVAQYILNAAAADLTALNTSNLTSYAEGFRSVVTEWGAITPPPAFARSHATADEGFRRILQGLEAAARGDFEGSIPDLQAGTDLIVLSTAQLNVDGQQCYQ